ncbi:hemerythrin domain-containing protein [Catellatospora sp. NPDC049609]|uniref:hemerythrin domain-containing protein n=1 Tax=Catellatospora sp. NPDC049609 TaxID=3155505 RepID=UPI0034177F0E
MDAIELLIHDHRRFEALYDAYERSRPTATDMEKRALVDRMIEGLTAHAFIEETIFYPAARQAVPQTTDHILESVEEHHVAAWLLSELRDLEPEDEKFDAKVAVLIEQMRHHQEEEEQDWFPEVRAAMGAHRLDELGQRMQAARDEAPADPLGVPSARS